MTKRSSTAAFSTAGSSRPSSSLSALTAVTQGGRDSVPLSLPPASPSFPPPSNPSHHRTPSNFSATAESPRPPSLSRPHSSTPPPAQSSLPAPLPAPFLFPQSATHLRSVSYSSISTALDSAPRTPADFSKDFRDSVRVLSFVQDVDSPSEIDADITLSAVDLSIDPAEAISDSHKTSPVLHPESRSPVRSSSQETLNNVEIEPPSFLESEPTARFSRLSANSDGEVGIGLSLLQDFINDAADDSNSVASSRSSYQSVVISPSNTVNYTSKPDADLPVESPTHSQHPLESPTSPASQHDLSTTSQSPVPPVTREAISRNSTQPSVTDSEYGGEDWEGASDIYDNYRYSRLSMASKVSRLSKGSMHTVASAFGLEVPPPVPRDTSRSSLDSQRPIRSRVGSLGENSQPAEGVIVSVDSTVNSAPAVPPLDVKVTTVPPERKKTDEGKHVPSPLTFAPGIISFGTGTTALQTSPLLHTTFASPVGSPSAHSMNAFLSPNPSSPTYPSAIGGIASALRQKIEMERAVSPAAGSQRSVSPSPSALSENQGPPPSINRISTQPIVQDDDGNEGPSTDPPDLQAQERESESPERVSSPESAPPTTAPTSAGSVVVSEKAALESTQVVANPPPPYTPIAVASETQTELHVQATSSSSHQTDPSPPVARPLNPNRSPASPSARQSLFLPHPHAPKPTLSPTGPMYGRAPPPVSPLSPPLTGPLPGSLTHTLSTLYSHRFEQGPFRRTLYGKFDHDLAYSSGPIPISFTLEPPQSIPANRMPPSNRPMHQSTSLPDMLQQSSINGAPTVPSTDSNGFNQVVVGKTIPRANFFPKVQTPRPRSRSFSGFDASGVAPEVAMKERR